MAEAGGQLVRWKKGKKTFEVITNSGSVLKYRDGKESWSNVLMADVIFKNYSKGERASAADLE